MSIFYHYPSKNTVKSIQKEFDLSVTENDHIFDIWTQLTESGFTDAKVGTFLLNKCGLSYHSSMSVKETIDMVENACRVDGKAVLGPGAMSNFPDRYDGFHTYNRCCRKKEDKGLH